MKPALKAMFSINPFSLTSATIVVVWSLFAFGAPFLDLMELRSYDLRFLYRGARPTSPAVVLAMIDEKSLDEEGRWPWPRSKLAALVDRLSEGGAKVIAFDIGFFEPETVEGDEGLTRAISESSAAVVLGYFFHMDAAKLGYQIDGAEIDRRLRQIASSKYPAIVERRAIPDRALFPRAYAPECNLAQFSRAADGSGYFTVRQDHDGVVRWMPLVIGAGEEVFPPLSILATWHYLDRPRLELRLGPQGVEGIVMGDRRIPTDAAGRLLVNYLGGPKTFAHVSVTDILRGRAPDDAFRDRIVLVGASATGIYDVRSTPFSTAYPGVEIHATVVDNVLTGNFATRPPWSSAYDVLAIAALAALGSIVSSRVGALVAWVFTVGLLLLHVAVANRVFASNAVWLNVVYPSLALVIVYTVLTAYRFMTEQRERQKLSGAFGHYVAPVVIESMLKDPSRLRLGGEERVLTVLFSDLQGFTSYSERYSPQQMIEILSEYYARMTEVIFAREGMLKEYVGDELMAIFGAPIEHANHAELACLAALDMREARKAIGEEWARAGRPKLVARTGVNSGPMLVGNLGSQYRYAYGVLGDNVNLGSRLEGLNKEYGTEILIGENTVLSVGQSFQLREVDLVRVVGRASATRLYELLAPAAAQLPDAQRGALDKYAVGLAAYRERRWQDAIRAFNEASTRWPDERPAHAMIRRCLLYEQSPPAEDWAGVFDATQK